MQVKKQLIDPTHVTLSITADLETLKAAKAEALAALAPSIKVPGFRSGKVPTSLIEKHASPGTLQAEFLERAVNRMYEAATAQEDVRPVGQPRVTIKKFVPYDTLEVEAAVEALGEITLGDYKKLRLARKTVTVTPKEIDEVIERLRIQAAVKKDVSREAKDTDEVWIDFSGVDDKTGDPIKGADGKNYPLLLGSNTFIPGFETNLIGLKAGQEKTFTLTFPKDYGVKLLQSRKVRFNVVVLKVQQVTSPKLDDAFAATVGSFKGLTELKADIKKQLISEKQLHADQAYADELLKKLTEKSTVILPASVIDEEVNRLTTNKRQDVIYRGQTWQEFLEAEGLSEEQYQKGIRPEAELRLKASLVLIEVADKEKVTITPEERREQMESLRSRHEDPKMRAELSKPEAEREIASRMLSEKTMKILSEYAAKKN